MPICICPRLPWRPPRALTNATATRLRSLCLGDLARMQYLHRDFPSLRNRESLRLVDHPRLHDEEQPSGVPRPSWT